MTFIYLASPYSDKLRSVRFGRYALASQCTANLYKKGITVFSPIVHCHSLAIRHDFPTDNEFWKKHNRNMLNAAEALYVLRIEGWDTSKGVLDELKYAEGANDDGWRPRKSIKFVTVLGETRPYVRPDTWQLD